MNKSIVGLLVLLALVIVAGIFFLTGQTRVTERQITQPSPEITAAVVEEEASETLTEPATVKEFNIEGKSFEFSQTELRVKKGDQVRINFNNTQGVHDLTIDELNVATKIIQVGQSDTVEFVADETGVFEFYCSVGNHRQLGMVGKLIVE